MECLFSPCNRFHDRLESQGRLEEFRGHHPEPLQELNLNLSTQELLSAERAFTYWDLYDILGNKDTVAWLSLHAFVAVEARGGVVRSWLHLDREEDLYCFAFSVDNDTQVVAVAFSPEYLLEICDVALRLVAATSAVESVILNNWCPTPGFFINAPTLAFLMEQCQSLKALLTMDLQMDEDHCRVLGAYSRPDLEIVLLRCTITSAGASALAEVLGRNQGPTELVECGVDNLVLADGLCGNSRLESLTPRISSSPEDGNQELLAIADAVRENKGLVDLDLCPLGFSVTDETWDAVCKSLHTHLTLEVLDLRSMRVFIAPSAVINSRIQALLDMLKVNISIHTILLDSWFSEHETFRGSIVPYLETNQFRPHVRAIQKLAQLRTGPRCWDERCSQLVPMQIAFGCFYQGMPKSPFRRRL
jgi:hypothetical protein